MSRGRARRWLVYPRRCHHVGRRGCRTRYDSRGPSLVDQGERVDANDGGVFVRSERLGPSFDESERFCYGRSIKCGRRGINGVGDDIRGQSDGRARACEVEVGQHRAPS